MSLREECDAAEVVWGRLLDRHDQLRLLAASAQVRDYEPMSVRLSEVLNEDPGTAATVPRELEVLQFVAETREG